VDILKIVLAVGLATVGLALSVMLTTVITGDNTRQAFRVDASIPLSEQAYNACAQLLDHEYSGAQPAPLDRMTWGRQEQRDPSTDVLMGRPAGFYGDAYLIEGPATIDGSKRSFSCTVAQASRGVWFIRAFTIGPSA